MKMNVSKSLMLLPLVLISSMYAAEPNAKHTPTNSDAKASTPTSSASTPPSTDSYVLRKTNRPIIERIITGDRNYLGYDLIRDLKAMQHGNTVNPDDSKSMANIMAAIGDIKTRNDFEQAEPAVQLLHDRKVHVEQTARRTARQLIRDHRDKHGTEITKTTLDALKKLAEETEANYKKIMQEFETQKKIYEHNDKLLGMTYRLHQRKVESAHDGTASDNDEESTEFLAPYPIDFARLTADMTQKLTKTKKHDENTKKDAPKERWARFRKPRGANHNDSTKQNAKA